METQRTVQIILMELTTDKLKLEEELEQTINNSNYNITTKTNMIKDILSRMVINDASLAKWHSMMNNNNNTVNQENNGDNK